MLETLANKMTLAEGVLDGTEKSLSEAKLKRGRDANLARLQQILPSRPDGKPAPKAPPADPSLAFAERAAAALGPALLHCQEAMLPGQDTPVLLTVLRDPTRAAAVSALFHETDWRGAPPNLHVLDAVHLGRPPTARRQPASSPSTPAPPATSPATLRATAKARPHPRTTPTHRRPPRLRREKTKSRRTPHRLRPRRRSGTASESR